MKRRDAIKNTAAIFTVTGVIPGLVLSQSCSPEMEEWKSFSFNKLEGRNLRTVIDVLIPQSGAPSATDVKVHVFIDGMVSNIFSGEHRQLFLSSLSRLNSLSQEVYGEDFYKIDINEQNDIVLKLRKDDSEQDWSGQFYNEIKNLTLTGYFRSEEVCTHVLKHVPVPGRFEGCIKMDEGHPLWAER